MNIDLTELSEKSRALGRFIADSMTEEDLILNRKNPFPILSYGISKCVEDGFKARAEERRAKIGKV